MRWYVAGLIFPLILFLVGCSEEKKKTTTGSSSSPSSPTVYLNLSLSLDSGATHTNIANVNAALTSSDSPTEMYLTQVAGCASGGVWQSFSSPVVWTLQNLNLSNTVYAKVRDGTNESECQSASILHDNTAPTVSWSTPTNSSTFNASQASSMSLTGACSESGLSVQITGAITATANCVSSAWSTTADLSGLSDGSVSLQAQQTDAAGNVSTAASLSLTKDTTAPSGNSIQINGGATITGTTSVSLTLTSTGASEMYITNTAACASGGTWEAYSSGKSWTLPNSNASNTVYAKYRDSVLNESSCVSASITHDSSVPVLTITSPSAGSYAAQSNVSSFTVSGACSAEGQNVVISGDLSGSTTCSSGTWSMSLNASGLGEGSFSLSADHSTAAMVAAPTISRSFVKDTVAPTGTSISINSAGTHTNSTSVTLTLAATSAAEMYVTNTAGCAAGGSWQTYDTSRSWTLGQTNATATVYGKFRDLAGNESSCTNDTIVHDSTAPTLAFSSPAANALINMFNVSSVTTSGTCSENGRTVTLSGSASGTATCSSGSWSTTLNYTSASDGTVSVQASITDLAGNTTNVSRSFNKDVTPPSNPDLVIGSGAGATNNTSTTLTTTATGASEMYVTDDPSCTAGGSWVTYATTQSFILTPENSVASVFARYRDSNLNETNCVAATVIVDTNSPVWLDRPLHSSVFNSTTSGPSVSYLESAIDEDSGVAQYQYAVGTGTSGSALNDVSDWQTVTSSPISPSGLSVTTGATYYINMKAIDNAGNESILSSSGWLVDNVPPTLSFISHSQNQVISEVDQKITGTCESPYVVSFAYGSDITGDASVSCTSNTFVAYLTISGSNGSRTVTASQVDGAMNTQTLGLTLSYQAPLEIGGTVLAMAELSDGSMIYGGSFTSVSTSRTPGLVRTNTSGVLDGTLNVGSGFNGQIFAAVELGDGSVIVGGDFTTYRSKPALRIAKISSTGTLDSSFNPLTGSNGFNSVVRAMTLVGSDLYVGGDFTLYRGAPANRIAKISTSGTLDTTFNPSTGSNGANNRIRGLAVNGSQLYIGGDFTLYKGASAKYVAKLDLSGNLDTTFNPATGSNGTSGIVRAVVTDGTQVYIGGDFLYYRGAKANRIAKVSSSGVLDTTFNPASGNNGSNSSVYALTLDGSDLYAAGAFTTYRGTAANRIAKITASTGALNTTFNPTSGANGANNIVTSVVVSASQVYIGGFFTTYRNANAQRVARVSTAGVLNTTYNPASGANGANNTVNTLFASATQIYIGGAFSSYRSALIANNIAKVTSGGALDTTFNPQSGSNGVNGAVRAIVADSTSVYIGGDFTTYQGASANRLAKMDHNGVLDTLFTDSGSNGTNGVVRALALNSTDLYVGGDFTQYRGYLANRIVKLEITSGGHDTNFSPTSGSNGVNSSVRALALDGSGYVYAGGSFTTYRGGAANRVAKIDVSTGNLDTTFNPTSGSNGFNSHVYALHINGSDLFAGGSFTTYRGGAANRVAKLNFSGSLNTTFNPTSGANGVNSTVLALASSATQLYIGGTYSTYRGSTVNNICRVNLSTAVYDNIFSPVTGGNGTSGPSPGVNAMAVNATHVYIGGSFTRYRSKTANNNVRVDATTGAPLY